MLRAECERIYTYLFKGRDCPADLPDRYIKAHEDLGLAEGVPLPDDIGAAEFSVRRAGVPHPLTAKMKLVAYLAETSEGHYELMHAPKPRFWLFVLLDMGWGWVRAKVAKFRGATHGL